MCQFCVQHGQGRIWYLQAANHSRAMMDKLSAEKKMRRHARRFENSTVGLLTLYDRLSPLWRFKSLKRLAHFWATRRQKKRHFGQILPTEHVRKVFHLARSIVRLPCTCRRFLKGRTGDRFCLGLGFDPYRVYADLPEYDGDFEVLDPSQAWDLTDKLQREKGLVHTVWTLPTPFVAAVCNCNMTDCGAMLTHFKLGIPVLFPGEMKISLRAGLCRGCRRCILACPFGAITYDRRMGKAVVDGPSCQGCGLCRTVCPEGALLLVPAGFTDIVGEEFALQDLR